MFLSVTCSAYANIIMGNIASAGRSAEHSATVEKLEADIEKLQADIEKQQVIIAQLETIILGNNAMIASMAQDTISEMTREMMEGLSDVLRPPAP